MIIPTIHSHPVCRPSFIQRVQWNGDDDDLQLLLSYLDDAGQPETFDQLYPGVNCFLNSDNHIQDTPENPSPIIDDCLIAHLRMSTLISKLVPGSSEWIDSFLEGDTKHLQTATGQVKVMGVSPVDDVFLDVVVAKVGQTGKTRTVRIEYRDMADYQFTPSTGLWVVAGSLEKQFASYVHTLPSGPFLSQAQKDNVEAYLLSLDVWM
jgi:hypothetical protein